MKVIYEKLESTKDEISFKAVDKATATHEHICYHDEKNPQPCVRRKL